MAAEFMRLTPRHRRPDSLSEALALSAEAAAAGRSFTALAGGTDLYPARSHAAAWFGPAPGPVLDLSGVAELAGVSEQDGTLVVGALTTWSALDARPLPPAFDALKQAGRQIGGRQIQNRGTLAGNLCNASPAADGAPPLLALDAEVELASSSGLRRLRLADFLLGNRRTALQPGELMTAIRVPSPPAGGRSCFLKLGARAHLVISIASVTVLLARDGTGAVSDARIAVGACSAVPQRLRELERRLLGRSADAGLAGLVRPDDLAVLTPIDDVRATADYRRAAAGVLIRRALTQLATPVGERAA